EIKKRVSRRDASKSKIDPKPQVQPLGSSHQDTATTPSDVGAVVTTPSSQPARKRPAPPQITNTNTANPNTKRTKAAPHPLKASSGGKQVPREGVLMKFT
ncbi:hypothetical protein HK102_012138, partial [Quaeritorhiza haematococci]